MVPLRYLLIILLLSDVQSSFLSMHYYKCDDMVQLSVTHAFVITDHAFAKAYLSSLRSSYISANFTASAY